MQKIIITLIIFSFFVFQSVSAESVNVANTEKSLSNVKDTLDDLLIAKDQNKPTDLAFRVEAFSKVLEFSENELRDLKVRLLTLDMKKNDPIYKWRESILKRISDILAYLDNEAINLEKKSDIDLEGIITTAKNFKFWREENYSPIANQISEYLILDQEKKVIEIAMKRAEKIGGDIIQLKKNKYKVVELERLLTSAKEVLNGAKDSYEKANALFMEKYVIIKNELENKVETATSSEIILESTATTSEIIATSTENNSSSTSLLSPPQLSIKDLVKDSLTKIKRSYQIFIEMSNFVRKLFN